MVEYCISLFKKEEEDRQFKDFGIKTLSYLSQGLQFISHNTAYIPAYFSEESQVLIPFKEFLDLKEDERTAEEMRDAIIDICGLGG